MTSIKNQFTEIQFIGSIKKLPTLLTRLLTFIITESLVVLFFIAIFATEIRNEP